MTTSALALIPARRSSKRLPRKHLRQIEGVLIIEYTIKSALDADLISDVVVSTDDLQVAEVARAGGGGVLERPPELCRDLSPIDGTLRHAVPILRESLAAPLELLVWPQADAPIRLPGMIDRAVATLRSDLSATAAVTCRRVSQHPAWMKFLYPKGFLVPLEPDAEAFRLQDLPDRFLLDGAVVAIRTENLEQYGAPTSVHMYLGPRPRLLVHQHRMYSLNVETNEHLELAEFYLRHALRPGYESTSGCSANFAASR